MKQIIFPFFFLTAISFSLIAQPGFLDPTFGDSGKVVSTLNASLHSAILQNSGKIVAGGISDDFVLTRFLKGGIVDTTFGKNGLVTNIFPGYYQELNKIISLPENKFITLAFGFSSHGPYNEDILLAKYDSEGNPDLSFGDSGRVIADFGYYEEPTNMVMQPDGKFLISGTIVTNIAQQTSKVFTARFKPDGTIDENYGINGLRAWNGFTHPTCRSLALQTDGKIVIAVKNGSTPYYFNLIRFNANGSFDSSFGTNGLLKTDLTNSTNEFLNDVIVQPNGKIVATGMSKFNGFYYDGQMTVVRYNSDGSLDDKFGSGGIVYSKFDNKNNSQGLKLCLKENGKIIIGGINFSNPNNGEKSDFALLQLNPNGSIDSSFGEAGGQVTDLGGYDYIQDLILQEDGKILTIGEQDDNYYYALARYLGDPVNQHPTFSQIKRWIKNHILHFQDNNPNTDFYVIEQSKNATNGFVPVTKIDAIKVNTTYNFPLSSTQNMDPFYRIKSVSNDNSVMYSPVISSNDDAAVTTSSIKIFPNPAKNSITIQSSKATTVRLQNSNGLVLLTQKINGNSSMDISKLPNGIYYVVNADSGESFKVVKE